MTDPVHVGPTAMRTPPSRFDRPGIVPFVAAVVAVALIVSSMRGTGFSLSELVGGLPHMGRILGEMMPPSLDRIGPVSLAVVETLHMALAGTFMGALISVPLAVLAARNLTVHPVVYQMARGVIALCRTVPDLVWALFFVAAVGLGPFAGTLAIMVDKIGFCGRFFAEAMEEADRGPQEALRALGASRGTIVAAAVLPAAFPSMIATAMFALEKAARASVVLGLVGAGGIGIELQVSMDMFRYDEAATIIGAIFLLVLAVERLSAEIRRRVM
jgi:phosphonate transport system permease protein